MGCYIIIAEGITDCALIECTIDKFLKYKTVDNFKALPGIWKSSVGKFPPDSGCLERRIDVPTFFTKNKINIAIKQANGCSNIPRTLNGMLQILLKEDNINDLKGILIVMDTDTHTHEHIIDELQNKMKEYNLDVDIVGSKSIKVEGVSIKFDTYFMPNSGRGAIEKVLLQCTELLYPEMYSIAKIYSEELMKDSFKSYRQEEWSKDTQVQSFYMDKVHFGAISIALKPDKSMRFAIKDKIIRNIHFDKLNSVVEFKKLIDFLNAFLK